MTDETLAIAAALLTGLIGIPLGALAVPKQNTWIDYIIPVVTSMGFILEGLIVTSAFTDTIFAVPGFGRGRPIHNWGVRWLHATTTR